MKTALITGAARGIGEGLARGLHARGYAVALVGLEFERMRGIAAELNASASAGAEGESSSTGRSKSTAGTHERAIAIEADVTDSAALDRAVAAVVARWNRLDVVVANAGIANNGSFASTHVDDLVRVVDVNLNGVIRTMKSSYDALVESRGYALIISSLAAFPAMPGISAYAASKSGVDHLANCLRIELLDSGVEVGVAYPSWVDTDLVRDHIEEMPHFAKALEAEPNFFGRVTPLEDAVAALVEAVEQRRRRVYIPDFVGFVHLLRTATVSSLWDMAIGFVSRKMLPSGAEPARAAGAAFGKSSAELARRKK